MDAVMSMNSKAIAKIMTCLLEAVITVDTSPPSCHRQDRATLISINVKTQMPLEIRLSSLSISG